MSAGGFGSRKQRRASLKKHKQHLDKAQASPYTMATDAAAAVVGSYILRGGIKDGAVEYQLQLFIDQVRIKILKSYNPDGSFREMDDE